MVYREKNFDSPPDKLTDNKWDELKANLLLERENHDVKTACYRDTTIDELMSIYKDKCAICERSRGTELQVDHYRPKKPRNNITRIEYNHPGYYWLAYTWSNLMPLCSKCNNNKSNKFPLRGWNDDHRVSDHDNIDGVIPFFPYDLEWLHQKERPLMINPELDKSPERHFYFKTDGKIYGNTIEGKETIRICKLNRKDLIRERMKIKEDYYNDLKSALDNYENDRDEGILRGDLRATFRRMKRNCHPDREHSYYNIFVYNYFHEFIDAMLPSNLKGKLTNYFNQFNDNQVN